MSITKELGVLILVLFLGFSLLHMFEFNVHEDKSYFKFQIDPDCELNFNNNNLPICENDNIDADEIVGPINKKNSRHNSRANTIYFGSNTIKFKRDQPKNGFIFQLQKDKTVIDAKITIKGLPSYNLATWGDLACITDHINDGFSKEPAIAVDKDGTSHAVWKENGRINGPEFDWDIIYAKNHGDTWQPFEVVSSVKPDSPSNSPDIAIDDSNRVHIVWVDRANIDNNSNDKDIFYRYRHRVDTDKPDWSAEQVISDEAGYGNSTSPQIAINQSGNIFIVWQDDEKTLTQNSDNDILCKIWHSEIKTWSSTYILSNETNNGESITPEIASDGENVYVVWSDNGNILESGADSDIFMRTWNGSAWEDTIIISNHNNTSDSLNPSIDAKNEMICIVWEDIGDINSTGADKDILMKRYSNSNWSDTVVITESDDSLDGESIEPDVIIDLDGNIHVIWSDDLIVSGDDPDFDIIYRLWDSTKENFGEFIIISDDASAGNSRDPYILVNNNARVEMVWTDDGDINDNGFDPDIMYRGSKFIYPTDLKLLITSASSPPNNGSTMDENFHWEYLGELTEDLVLDGQWLSDRLNEMIKNMDAFEEDFHMYFKSNTNGSLKITDFEIKLTYTPEKPTELQIINEEQNHVISHTPIFSWKFIDKDSFQQKGYEIQVGSEPGLKDMWKYGPISSDITYKKYEGIAGKPLLDGHTYYFRVRVKDDEDAWSDWSEYQNFTMNSKPEIILLTPISGTADESIRFNWLGYDENGDNLTYTIQVKYNDTWYTELVDTPKTQLIFNTSNLEPEQLVDIQCRCSDGYEYSSEDWFNEDGSIIIIHNKPPSIIDIKTPPKGITMVNDSYVIQWTSYDPDKDDTHTINIYYDEDTDFNEKTEIASNLVDDGSHTWNSLEVDPGEYYILIAIYDGKSYGYKYSEGIIIINHSIDTSPPKIVETKPKLNSQNISITQDIRIRFNKPMDTLTLMEENIIIKDTINRIVKGYILYDSSNYEMIFIPSLPSKLDYGQKYSITVKWEVKDLSGNYLDGNGDSIQQQSTEDDYTWSFSTLPWGVDASPPKILLVTPKDTDSDIDVRLIIKILFSEDMDPDSINPSTVFVLDSNGRFVDGEFYFVSEGKELHISLFEDLKYNMKYIVLVTAGVRDISGHGLDGNESGTSEGSPMDDYSWSFTTKKAGSSPNKEENDIGYNPIFMAATGISIVIILIIILGAILKKHKEKQGFNIHDIFIIYNDGRLLAHQSFEKKSNVDEGSLGGMLTAIQNFINESFFDQDEEVLEEIKYGKLKIFLIHGKDVYLAVICSGDTIPNKFQKDMKRLLLLIELKFGNVLKNWDGNMRNIRDIEELIKF